MASNDDKVEELLNNGVCACFPMYGQRSGCPFCRTKRAREEAKFNELIGKNLNLEMKGKYLLRRQMESKRWKSLSVGEIDELKLAASNYQNKKPIEVFEERFSATVNIDDEWGILDLCDKISWMEAAEACLYEEDVVEDNKKRLVLVERAG